MYLAYIDESGDDGFPKYSTKLFVLTACYFNEDDFTQNFSMVKSFRKQLKEKYGLPMRIELHMRELIQNKKPYIGLGLTKEGRQSIIHDIFQFINLDNLPIRFISVVLDKTMINSATYNVLDKTLSFLLQRIHNDLQKNGKHQFMSIADQGRVQIMNKTARKLRTYNYLPSQIGVPLGNQPLDLFIEDILEKSSTASPFIQLADCVSRIVNLYTMQHLCDPKQDWIRKTLKMIPYGEELKLLDMILPKLNIHAARNNKYGIKYIP